MAAADKELTLSEARKLARSDPSALFSEMVEAFGKDNEVWWNYSTIDSRLKSVSGTIFLLHGTEVYRDAARYGCFFKDEDFITLKVSQDVRKAVLEGKKFSSIDDFVGKLSDLMGGKGSVSIGYIFPNPERFKQMQSFTGTPCAAINESPALVSFTLSGYRAPKVGLAALSGSAHIEVSPPDLAREASLVSDKLLVPKEMAPQESLLLPQMLNVYVQCYYAPNLKKLAKR